MTRYGQKAAREGRVATYLRFRRAVAGNAGRAPRPLAPYSPVPSLGERQPRGDVGRRDRIDQNPVEQIDVIGSMGAASAREDQIGKPSRRLGPASGRLS